MRHNGYPMAKPKKKYSILINAIFKGKAKPLIYFEDSEETPDDEARHKAETTSAG